MSNLNIQNDDSLSQQKLKFLKELSDQLEQMLLDLELNEDDVIPTAEEKEDLNSVASMIDFAFKKLQEKNEEFSNELENQDDEIRDLKN